MSRMFSSLTDVHSLACDVPVSQSELKPGTPLLVPIGNESTLSRVYHVSIYSHFGASLAPLPDSTAFVYYVVENHPLGLEPGDIVLGYDNIPWKILYKELLAAELPLYGSSTYGSSQASVTHGFLAAVGENWHLFDTIDIVKYSTGDTLHLPTSLLADQQMELYSSDQLPVPGVSFPDVDNGHMVSWGIVEGTNIGYIYAWSWTLNTMLPPPSSNAGDEFLEGLNVLVNDYRIDGLIIDSRFNMGGWTYQYLQCLSYLFNEDQDILREYVRASPTDHLSMQEQERVTLKFTATDYLFDHPIAMLTGPASSSCGDTMPLTMRRHPMVRTFGLGTNGAYGAVEMHPDFTTTYPDWIFTSTISNIVLTDQPDLFLTHLNIPPDEEIWLTQEDAVKHEDTVVKRALDWITELSYAHDALIDTLFAPPTTGSLFISTRVENPNQHPLEVWARIKDTEGVIVDSVQLSDDGQHPDSAAGDGIWGNSVTAPENEAFYTADIITKDPVDSTMRILPHVLRFTTVGPLELADTGTPYIDSGYDSLRHIQQVKFILHNGGNEASAQNIKVVISTEDPRVLEISRNTIIWGNITAGARDTSSAYMFRYDSGYGPENTIGDPIRFSLAIYTKNVQYWTANTDYVTALERKPEDFIPLKYNLAQNYPNPFNPKTTIEFRIPVAQFVSLKIYNLLGQKVATLVSARLLSGNYKFIWDANGFASGIYLCQIKTGEGFAQTKKLILLK